MMNTTRMALAAVLCCAFLAAQPVMAATDTTINDGSTLVEAVSRSVTLNSGSTDTIYDLSNGSTVEIPNGVTINFTQNGGSTGKAVLLTDSSFIVQPGGTFTATENSNGQGHHFETSGASSILIGGTVQLEENGNGGSNAFRIAGTSTFNTLSGAIISVVENGGNNADGNGVIAQDDAVVQFADNTIFTVEEGLNNSSANNEARLFLTNNNAQVTVFGGTYSVDQNEEGDGYIGVIRGDSSLTILGGDFTLDESGSGNAVLFQSEDMGHITIAGGTYTGIQQQKHNGPVALRLAHV